MINRFRVQNYKALRDVSLDLTPIHVLIGPNDSGKTSILSALAALCRSVDLHLEQAFGGAWDGRELVWHGDSEGVVRLSADLSAGDIKTYALDCRFPNAGRQVRVERESFSNYSQIDANKGATDSLVRRVCVRNAAETAETQKVCRAVHEGLSGVHYYRWNPRTLALPVAPDSARQFRLNSDGFGLALLLDDILGFDRDRFNELEARFRSIFPEITSIKLLRQPGFRAPRDDVEQVSKLNQADGKGVYFALRGNQQLVPASQVSDGIMMILGYLAILYTPHSPRVLLIDEPENGIHPKRLQEVLNILREIVSSQVRTQLVLTTHSPYAVSLFEPGEVTLCTKSDGEVKTKRLSDSKLVEEQGSLFTLGEIWTAEGDEDLAQDNSLSRS
ncbi:MAG: AAA family ATPase [Pirellulaceae bacterium]